MAEAMDIPVAPQAAPESSSNAELMKMVESLRLTVESLRRDNEQLRALLMERVAPKPQAESAKVPLSLPPAKNEDGFQPVGSRGVKRTAVASPPSIRTSNCWGVLDSLPDSQSESSETDFPPLEETTPARQPAKAAKQAPKAKAASQRPSTPAAPRTQQPRPTPASQPAPTPAAQPAPTPAAQQSTQPPSVLPMEKTPKIPPIILRDPSKWLRMSAIMADRNIRFTKARQCPDGIRIQVPDVTNYRGLTILFQSMKVEYHSYTLEEEKTNRAVLRPVPTQIGTKEIADDLVVQGFHPIKVTRLISNRTKGPMPLVLVEFPHGENPMEITAVCNLIVTAEKPRKSGRPSQCHRCQLFHHSQRNCHAEPRCVKCAGAHHTNDCGKDRSEAPRCSNCQGVHTANYMGCPKFPGSRRRPAPKGTPTATRSAPKPTTAPAPAPAPKPTPQPAPKPTPVPSLDEQAKLISSMSACKSPQEATALVLAFIKSLNV